MIPVAILGGGTTHFGKLEAGLLQLLTDASIIAMDDSATSDKKFDHVYVGNMASGELNGKSGIANMLTSDLGLEPAFSSKIENTSGSGGAALYAGWLSVASGQSKLTLVVGGEKMSHMPTSSITSIIASLVHEVEYECGVTLPSFAGLLARYYMNTYGATRESIAAVSVKNHYNATLNPHAHFKKKITIENVLESPIISDPLTLYDICPISDGASAIVLSPLEDARKYVDNPIKIKGIGGATDTHIIHERENLNVLKAVKKAGEKAYQMAQMSPDDIQIAELHDMATILEIVQSEDLGFFEKGNGWRAVEEGITSKDGRLPINMSGGLKAKGHPIGATGVAQVLEITHQIQGKCGARQIDVDRGLACNVAGFGNNAIVTVMESV